MATAITLEAEVKQRAVAAMSSQDMPMSYYARRKRASSFSRDDEIAISLPSIKYFITMIIGVESMCAR